MTRDDQIIEEDPSVGGLSVSEIIDRLKTLDPDHIPTVLVWDSEYEMYFAKSISGIEIDPDWGVSGRARIKL